MRNARLDEALARIKIVGRNINNIRYSDKTKESLGMQEQKKTDTYHLSLLHVVTINGFQILLEKYQ